MQIDSRVGEQVRGIVLAQSSFLSMQGMYAGHMLWSYVYMVVL